MRPVPVGIDPKLAAFLTEVRSAVSQLQNLGKPPQEFAILFADLPPPANYPNCRAMVTDKNALAISTSVAGVWTWLRADGGAL